MHSWNAVGDFVDPVLPIIPLLLPSQQVGGGYFPLADETS